MTEKMRRLRELMREQGMDAYIVVTDDYHGSEYPGDFFKEREFLTGFTGSAGTLVVTEDFAGLWTDGRYFLQAAAQLKGSGIELMKSGEEGVLNIPDFLAENLSENAVIGFDGRTVSFDFASEIEEKTARKNMRFSWECDLPDEIWEDRPRLSAGKIYGLSLEQCGILSSGKLIVLRNKMKSEGADHIVITALDEIAYLLNCRGSDVPYTPVFLSFMIVSADSAVLYAREGAAEDMAESFLGQEITVKDYGDIYRDLEALDGKIMLDGASANYAIVKSLENKDLTFRRSPVKMMKALKTMTEIENIKKAHIKDGVAVTDFIYWLKKEVKIRAVSEFEAAKKIAERRSGMPGYVSESFAPIIAYGANAAIVHYEPTEKDCAVMEPRGLCLADTGGHYEDGTTDVTRTIVLGELTDDERFAYTIVLKGHINLARARFREGATGANLDVLAREPLWEHGMDYNHGTGHGVGYLLSVHEGPQSFQWKPGRKPPVKLLESMIITDEPGFYPEGLFGIRHENMLLVVDKQGNEFGSFLGFEPLTMVPFDREAIDTSLLDEAELEWLNAYHETVYGKLSPYFEGEELEWLREQTQSLK